MLWKQKLIQKGETVFFKENTYSNNTQYNKDENEMININKIDYSN